MSQRCINKVTLMGSVGRDPEVRYTSEGTAVANFTMATNETWKGKDGEKKEKTEWHRVVAWGKIAENMGEYVNKGDRLYIEGRIQTNEWEDKEGSKRETKEINVMDYVFLSNKNERPKKEEQKDAPLANTEDESNIPF